MNHLPLVSIVTPVYNGSDHLEELIRSVLAQDYPAIEHIVIDDGSADHGATQRVIDRYPHLRSWSRPNRGQYATINEGVGAARGEIITIISADDMYAGPDAISKAVEVLLVDREADAVYGVTLQISETGTLQEVQPPKRLPLAILPYSLFIAHCALFVRRSRLSSELLTFAERYRYQGDRDWILRLHQSRCRLRFLDHPIALYRCHAGQITRLRDDTAWLAELHEIDARHGVRSAVRTVVHAFLGAHRRSQAIATRVRRVMGLPSKAKVASKWIEAATVRPVGKSNTSESSGSP